MLAVFIVTALSAKNVFAQTNIVRIARQDRYKTSIEISTRGWQTAKNIIIVNGNNFPDALCAAPLAKQLDSPILLSPGDSLSEELLSKIKSLQPDNIFIIGGPGAISEDIANTLDSLGNVQVHRIYGNDRYSTSIAVASYFAATFGFTDNIVVASGEGFADALSVAPIAAEMDMPILLTSKDGFTEVMRQFLVKNNISKTYVVGGAGSISDNTLSKFPDTIRIWGQDRYETNINIIDYFRSTINYNNIFVASGGEFPDAVTASALVAKQTSALLLTPKVPSLYSKQFLSSFITSGGASKVDTLYVLGGTGAVTDETIQSLAEPTNMSGISFENFAGGCGITSQGDTVYYSSNSLDFDLYGAIYKMNKDGSSKVKILETIGVQGDLNVVGDWIYYINKAYKMMPDGIHRQSDTPYSTLYRVRTNGTDNTKLSDGEVSGMIVVGNYIYYNFTDMLGPEYCIYRINLDGSNKIKLVDYGNNNGAIINYTDKYIFYSLSGPDAGTYRVNLDGSNKIKLVDLYSVVYGTDDWVYSLAGDFAYVNVIYREKADGTEKAIIYDGLPTGNFITLLGDYIYFSKDNGIFRMKNDGTELTQVYTGSSGPISIVGDYIYFKVKNTAFIELKRINLDGSNEETLLN